MIYEFIPTQDLHGYDSPWPAGGGKNKLDSGFCLNRTVKGLKTVVNADGSIALTGTADGTGRYWNSSDTLGLVLPAGTYTLSPTILRVEKIGGYETGTFTLSAETTFRNVYFGGFTPGEAVNTIVYPQLELGSIATSYAPYSNICPPEGFNIWDPTNAEYIQVYAGYVNANTRELYLRPVYEEYAGEELVGPWMSSLDPYEEDTTPTEGAFVIDFGGELTSYEITPYMLQTLLDSLGIRQHFTDGAGLLNKLMDQAQGRVRSEEELLHLSRPLNVIAIGDQFPAGITFKPISKDVLPGMPGKFIR